MLAACDIQPGRRITAEEPFIILPDTSSPKLLEASEGLSKEQLDHLTSFPALGDAKQSSPVLARVNHFIPLSGSRDGYIAMFRNICRVSHSCVPNACFSWNDNMGKEGTVCLSRL